MNRLSNEEKKITESDFPIDDSLSKSVKEVFNTHYTMRVKLDWLKSRKFKFTNSDLLDIIRLNEELKNNGNVTDSFSNVFYASIILSQNGPFNNEVFDAYFKFFNISSIFKNKTNALIKLIEKTKKLNTEQKVKWLNSEGTLSQSFPEILKDFFMPGKAAKCGIDNTTAPFNRIIATQFMNYGYSSFNYDEDFLEFFWDTLDSLKTKDIIDWYFEAVKNNYGPEWSTTILVDYKNTPTEILQDCFEYLGSSKHDNVLEMKIALATHKNFPEDLKTSLYLETLDKRIMPDDVATFFDF